MLSLIICTYKRPLPIARLLQSVARQSAFPDEILVIDASPDEETKQAVEKFSTGTQNLNIRYIRAGEGERGLTRQRNKGISLAEGDLISFLDDDTVLTPGYFSEIAACFERHPDAIGVGGQITNALEWTPANLIHPASLRVFRWGNWEHRDDLRWRLRKLLWLDSPLPPGWMPPSGNGRSPFFPPMEGLDHQVESLMGCASTWRKEIFRKHQFSNYFQGYGLYEDLDFCVRVAQDGPIYLCTRAQLEHHHASGGRPDQFTYGKMVVRNGWFVWRRRWPDPAPKDQIKWWLTTFLLMFLRFIDLRNAEPKEALGRALGMLTLIWDRPKDSMDNERGCIS
jgi:GT2 family glycosyltransferase